MLKRSTTPIIGAICAAFLASVLPAEASILSGSAIEAQSASASSPIQNVVHRAPAGTRCLKWTRRMNPRHGFARRCVQWR